MIGKELLPLFGGAAGVWATCVVFFQCLLLLGYLYAHVSTRFLGKLQFPTHILLLSVAYSDDGDHLFRFDGDHYSE